MAIIVSNDGGNYIPAPPGMHAAICCDVSDLGNQETQWGTKHKIRVSWIIAPTMEDGRNFMVSKKYTASLHEKANLRKDLEGWRGRPFEAEELASFDMEKLLCVKCMVQVIQKPDSSGTGVYALVQTVTPSIAGQIVPAIPSDYVRWQDRPEQQEDGANQYMNQTNATEPPYPEEEIPF